MTLQGLPGLAPASIVDLSFAVSNWAPFTTIHQPQKLHLPDTLFAWMRSILWRTEQK